MALSELLLRSNPGPDAVANCGDAGQVICGAHCRRSSYLVIAWRFCHAQPDPGTLQL